MRVTTPPESSPITDEVDTWVARLQLPAGGEETHDPAASRAAAQAERQPSPKHDDDTVYPTLPALAQL